MPGPEHIGPKGLNSIHCLVDELPLVLMAAVALDSLEGGEAHDEVIDKLDGQGNEASLHIVVPFLQDDKVFFGGFHVVGVEDDQAEVDVGESNLAVDGGVPHVVGGVDDGGIDMELHGVGRVALDPEAGNVKDDVVGGVGGCECGEGSACGLSSVVYVVCVVLQTVAAD